MAAEKQRLTLDLESLFPGDTLKIGKNVIDIRPLRIKQIATITRKLKGIGKILSDEGVDWDNYSQPESILKIAVVLIDQFPEVISEASNIHIDDLIQLPVDILISVVDKVVEVNMKSKDKFEGNWESLTSKFKVLTEKPKPKSAKQSKN